MGSIPKIAIIGKQNVGKSTLFNALVKERKTITYNEPGTTRDIIQHKLDWGEGDWILADFPGFENPKKIRNDELSQLAVEKALASLVHYHLLLWVTSRKGLSAYEHQLHNQLRKTNQKYWLVVNFVDDPSWEAEGHDFHNLGVKETFFVSALNRRNLNSLITDIKAYFSAVTQEKPQKPCEPALAIIGKPNTGKSTLYNFLLKKERSLVSPVSGTTRDSLESMFFFHKQAFRIIDTAGLRKNQGALKQIDKIAEQRSVESIKKSSVVILLVDPQEGFDRQNKNMIQLIYELGKPMVAAVNKLDWVRKNQEVKDSLSQDAQAIQKMFWHFPLYFISAAKGDKVMKVIEASIKLHEKCQNRYSTPLLNKFLQKLKHEPILSNHQIKPRYITQINQDPVFILFTNRKKVQTSIQKFLISKLQEFLGISDLPVHFEMRT